MSLRTPSSSRSPDHNPHRTIYYLGYPLGRFVGLKHRQLARQVGVIITTGRIRRTSITKIKATRQLDDATQAMVKRRADDYLRFPGFRVDSTACGSVLDSKTATSVTCVTCQSLPRIGQNQLQSSHRVRMQVEPTWLYPSRTHPKSKSCCLTREKKETIFDCLISC
jgi:hypothetical protein